MSIITLSRIFLLTGGRPTLTRELTTPHLSSFITVCLNVITIRNQTGKTIDLSSELLETVLQCFIRLLPNHPAIFRPFSGQIRSLISLLLAPTPSYLTADKSAGFEATNSRLSRLAHHLYALIPSCAARNGAAEEWKKSVHVILKHIHHTADSAFRAIVESQSKGHGAQEEIPQEPMDEVIDELSLSRWQGVAAGCERISGLLGLLSAYLSTDGNVVYVVPVKLIYELADRLLYVTYLPSTSSTTNSESINRRISREERELLYMQLPHIHAATLQLLFTVMRRVSLLSFSFAEDLLDQLAWIVQRSTLKRDLCVEIYQATEQIIELIGPSLDAGKSVAISSILRLACRDLLPQAEKRRDMSNGKSATIPKILQYDADSFAPRSKTTAKKQAKAIHQQNQAAKLLLTALVRIPGSTLAQVRLEIDTVAVLLQDQKLQLASILNPHQSSKQHNMNLVPFLDNIRAKDVLAQALIHRRADPIISQPVYEKEDSISEGQDTINSEPEVSNTDQPSFQIASNTKFQIPQVIGAVIQTSAIAEVIAGPSDQITYELESASDQSRLNLYSGTVLPQQYDQQDEDPILAHSKIVAAAETREVEMDSPARYESDDSSEIPEIVVDLDDSDEDDIDDDNDAEVL